jgi:hypothetical protein
VADGLIFAKFVEITFKLTEIGVEIVAQDSGKRDSGMARRSRTSTGAVL